MDRPEELKSGVRDGCREGRLRALTDWHTVAGHIGAKLGIAEGSERGR